MVSISTTYEARPSLPMRSSGISIIGTSLLRRTERKIQLSATIPPLAAAKNTSAAVQVVVAVSRGVSDQFRLLALSAVIDMYTTMYPIKSTKNTLLFLRKDYDPAILASRDSFEEPLLLPLLCM